MKPYLRFPSPEDWEEERKTSDYRVKSYIVMSEWLGGAAPVGVFTSLELAQKEAKKWCENHSDEWEEHEPSRCINITQCGEWWISIRKFEVNRLEIEE